MMQVGCAKCGKPCCEDHAYLGSSVKKFCRYKEDQIDLIENRPFDKNGFVKSDVFLKYGDYYFYQIKTKSNRNYCFCSRVCAVSFARERNVILKSSSTKTMAIVPNQSEIDRYAVNKGLKHHELAIKDGSKARIQELEYYLQLTNAPRHWFDFERMCYLALKAKQFGFSSLAKKAEDRLIDYSEKETCIETDSFLMLLKMNNNLSAIDRAFEFVNKRRGGIQNLDAATLANWAFFTVGPGFYDKAARLIIKAREKAPNDEGVFINYMAVMAASDSAKGIIELGNQNNDDYLNHWKSRAKTHLGLWHLGVYELKKENFQQAILFLKRAKEIWADSDVKKDLAEALWRAGKLRDALELVRDAKRTTGTETDCLYNNPIGGGLKVIQVESSSYETDRTSMMKELLALEGRILIEIGEIETGKQRLREAIDITDEVQSKLLDGVEKLVDNYRPRKVLQNELEQRDIKLVELEQALADLRTSYNDSDVSLSLRHLQTEVDVIEKASSAWAAEYEDLRAEAAIKAKLEHPEAFFSAFDPLNEAYFLMLVMNQTKGIRDWAAPMVYISKALELHLKDFLKHIFPDITSTADTLGGLEFFINNNAREILNITRMDKEEFFEWVKAIRIFRTKFRNGFVHAETMERDILMELFYFIKENRLFRSSQCS